MSIHISEMAEIIDLYPNNAIAKEAYSSYKIQLRHRIAEEHLVRKLRQKNSEVFNLISELPFSKLYISITSSDSLFYRFTLVNNSFEFKLEVFLDDEDIDIESILHVYKENEKVGAHFGTLEYLYNLITQTYVSKETSFDCYEYKPANPESYSIVSNYPEVELSYASNPGKEFSNNIGW